VAFDVPGGQCAGTPVRSARRHAAPGYPGTAKPCRAGDFTRPAGETRQAPNLCRPDGCARVHSSYHRPARIAQSRRRRLSMKRLPGFRETPLRSAFDQLRPRAVAEQSDQRERMNEEARRSRGPRHDSSWAATFAHPEENEPHVAHGIPGFQVTGFQPCRKSSRPPPRDFGTGVTERMIRDGRAGCSSTRTEGIGCEIVIPARPSRLKAKCPRYVLVLNEARYERYPSRNSARCRAATDC
jgi:hypothetical protein